MLGRFSRFGVGLLLAALFGAGGWYLLQPETRQADVRAAALNCLDHDKRVSPLDLLADVWALYYSEEPVAVTLPPGRPDSAVLAGGARPARPNLGQRVLTNAGYVVGYSDALRSPLWVSYRVWDLARLPVPPPRPDRFLTDNRTAARIRSDDYSGSGYDRGHLAPNYAIATRFGVAGQLETFLLSNIVPQTHSLNAGLWKELELRAATSYPARFREIWVMAGPVFGPQPARLRGSVPVPAACWMVMVDLCEGRLRAQAFILPQDAPAHAGLSAYLASIDKIEAETGLDLLPELPDDAEAVLEARTASRVW